MYSTHLDISIVKNSAKVLSFKLKLVHALIFIAIKRNGMTPNYTVKEERSLAMR